jgi:hypothetical protein
MAGRNLSIIAEAAVRDFMLKMKGYDAANLNLKAMMESEPKLAKILADMSQGSSRKFFPVILMLLI